MASSEDDTGEFAVAKNHVAFHRGGYRLRTVEDRRQMGDVVVEYAGALRNWVGMNDLGRNYET